MAPRLTWTRSYKQNFSVEFGSRLELVNQISHVSNFLAFLIGQFQLRVKFYPVVLFVGLGPGFFHWRPCRYYLVGFLESLTTRTIEYLQYQRIVKIYVLYAKLIE